MPERTPAGEFIDQKLTVRENGIATLELKGRRVGGNPLSIEAVRTLSARLDEVAGGVHDGSIRALVVTTSAPHSPLTGYNLEELRHAGAPEAVRWAREGQETLERLATLDVPTIAAIQGEWLGGGAELALACTHRVASDAKDVRIGFPQSRLGLLPSWGGTARLPRLIGLSAALDLVMTGRSLGPEEARRAGLVHRILPAGDFLLRAFRFAAQRGERARGSESRPVSVLRLIEDTEGGRRLIARRAARRAREGAPAGSASRRALELMSETAGLPLADALEREASVAGLLIATPDAQGRLHSNHHLERAVRRLPVTKGSMQATAVLGSGQTASDLAHLLASAGLPVKLKDVRHELVRAGVARARNQIEWEAQQGRITRKQADARASLIQGVTGYGGFGALDLVLAVSDEETRGVSDLLVEAEPHVHESCVLAFHDWAASATRIQRELTHSERVVGIAAALPLERFRLVEIVPGAQTGPDALHAVNRLLRKSGRSPLLVSDQTPTPATRLLGALFAESGRLLDDGATLGQVDDVAMELGFEVGPFHRIDAIGSRRVLRMLETLVESIGDRMAPGSHLARIGREAGTLYQYRGGHPAGSNPSLPAGLSPGGEALTRLIRERLLLILINEAAMILEDGSLTDPGDVEVISILGLGLSSEKGGLLFQAEEWGIDGVVATLSKRADRHGQRFAPADLLLEMAREGRRFFAG